jgi:ATP-dependent Lon protease
MKSCLIRSQFLPLRNMVLFPGVVIPITAGRDKSIKLINDANAAGKNHGVVAQR